MALFGLLLLLGMTFIPQPVLADAPGTRGPNPVGQGSIGTPATGAGNVTNDANRWRGVQELPPPSYAMQGSFTPGFAPVRQSGGENGPTAWLGRNLNPGNWILDAGMGIFAGIIKTFSGLLQKAHDAVVGNASVIPLGCDNAATNFVFCTPGSLTYDHPGVQAVWSILRGIAASIVTILFVVRLGRMIVEGPRTLATEGKSVLLTFLFALIIIQATYPVCKLLIDFFNGISGLLLSKAAITFPSVEADDLNIGSNLMFLFYWIVILLLTVKCFFRLVRIIVLISVAPLAGAMLMDRSMSGRFKSWIDKLIELFFEQINLVIVFVVAAAIVKPFQDRSLGDTFVMATLSIITLLMALMGPSMIGLAAGAGSMGYLQSVMTVGLLRRAGRAVGSNGRDRGIRSPDRGTGRNDASGGTGSGTARSIQGGGRAAGDPTQSAAAGRQNNSPTTVGRSAFRLVDAGDDLSNTRATARYQAAQVSRSASGSLGMDSRREQALMRATLMRQRAGQLRAEGDEQSANTLVRKARLHNRFGRGNDIARPAQFTPEQRDMRRQTYRQALTEVNGMHALERDALTQRIDTDEQRLPVLQRDLALAGSTGGDTIGLHVEHTDVAQRLSGSKTRLAALTPANGQQLPHATRQAAAALANERLPQELRSAPYQLRHGMTNRSAFVRRIAETNTQAAREELGQARATGARSAATPVDKRPPIAPPRKRSAAGTSRQQRGFRESREQLGADPAQESRTSHPSRAPSSTIARLRRQQIDAARNLPRIQRHDEGEE